MSALSGINISCIAKLKRSFFFYCHCKSVAQWYMKVNEGPVLGKREREHTLTQHKEACHIWGLNPHSCYFFFLLYYVCFYVSILCLQRSRSAFSLTSDDSPEKGPEEAGAGAGLHDYTSLKREGKATSLPTWKSVDRLDNSSKTHIDVNHFYHSHRRFLPFLL